MYKTAWGNVTTAEDTLWKVMAAYTAVFAALGFVSTVLGEAGFVLITVVFGLFGAAVSQNANLWFTRNMGMISGVEQEFLSPTDYGRLIPGVWRQRGNVPYVNREIWWLMTILFLAVSSLTVLVSSYTIQRDQLYAIVGVLVVGGALVGIYSGLMLYPSYRRFVQLTPSITPSEPGK